MVIKAMVIFAFLNFACWCANGSAFFLCGLGLGLLIALFLELYDGNKYGY